MANLIFLERFGQVCNNLWSSNGLTAETAMVKAKTFARGGEVIAIPGFFIHSLDKITGFQVNCGGSLYKNEEDAYDYDDVMEVVKAAKKECPKKTFVVVHIVDGVVSNVSTNDSSIQVFIADEDDQMEFPSALSLYGEKALHICDNPTDLFCASNEDSEKDAEINEAFRQQIEDELENPEFYLGIGENLKNTDGHVYMRTRDIEGFLIRFHKHNPFMKIEAVPSSADNDFYFIEDKYALIVKSGG